MPLNNFTTASDRSDLIRTGRQYPLVKRVGVVVCLSVAAGISLSGLSLRASDPAESESTRSPVLRTERPVPAKVLRYAGRLLERYDTNKNGRLEEVEWKRWLLDASKVDFNSDGVLTQAEIARRISEYGHRRHIRLISTLGQETGSKLLTPLEERPSGDKQTGQPAGSSKSKNAETVDSLKNRSRRFYVPGKRIPKGLPKWFLERDANGDGQLSLSEFSPRQSTIQAAQFASYDINGDGLLTAREYLSRARARKPNEPAAAEKPAK